MTYYRVFLALFAERVGLLKGRADQDTGMVVRVEDGNGGGTDEALRDGSGWRNSTMKEPSKRGKGPAMTGSSGVPIRWRAIFVWQLIWTET